MPDLQLQVRVEVDGKPLPGFPWLRRLTIPTLQGVRPYVRESNVAHKRTFPSREVESPQVIAILPRTAPISVTVQGEITSEVHLIARGLLLVFNGLCEENPVLTDLLNASGRRSDVEGFVGGVGELPDA